MKLQSSKKNMFVLASLLVASKAASATTCTVAPAKQTSPTVDISAMLTPAIDAERIIIDGFCRDISPEDKRSFNAIIDEVVELITYNRTFFVNRVRTKAADPESCIQEFLTMLNGLKSKSNAMEIVQILNRYKPMFNMLMPQLMDELLRYPFKTLNNLKIRIKRN